MGEYCMKDWRRRKFLKSVEFGFLFPMCSKSKNDALGSNILILMSDNHS